MKALVELIGNRVWLRTSAPTPGLGGRIKGANWRNADKVWTLPLRLDVCQMLRAEFGDNMVIGDALTEWAHKEVAKQDKLAALGSTLTASALSRVPELYPVMAKALASRPYQSVGANFVASGRSVLLADEPGLGKTLEAIAGIAEAGVAGPYLIAAPLVAMTEWTRQIQRWHPGANVVVAKGSHAQRSAAVGRVTDDTWLIINTDMIRTITWWVCNEDHMEFAGTDRAKTWNWIESGAVRWRASDKPKSGIINCGHELKRIKTVHDHKHFGLFAEPWGAIIMDEAHEVLIRLSGKPTMVRNGARLLPLRADGLKIACTGTPMRGKPHQLWGTLNWLRPKEHTGFWSWAETYFEVKSAGPFGGMVIGDLRPGREALMNQQLAGVMLRRTKKEVSPELPDKLYMGTPLNVGDESSPIAVWLPMEGAQARAYREMTQTGSAKVKGGTLDAVGALAEMTRLRQFATAYGSVNKKNKFKPTAPSNKLDWLIQFCRELGIVDGVGEAKIVVVSRFTSVLRAFAVEMMKLGIEVAGVTGAVTGKRRDAVVDAFNGSGGPRVLFLNTKAGGVAITLDAADDMVFLDETDRPDDQTQAEARINNRRPEEKVAQRRYWYLRSLGSIDEAIAAINYRMDLDQHALIDGRRGVAYARAVFDYLEGK